MYVSELDRPWTSTRFLFQGFEIVDEATLQELKETCEFVYIDTEKVGGAPNKPKPNITQSIEYTTVSESSSQKKTRSTLRARRPPHQKKVVTG